jgi:gliding motility-associated protein GldM
MAHGKETPRQKMIGMMYLVLTSMLALNVSKEVLDAFVFVDNGLTKTTENFSEKNSIIYNEFDVANLTSPGKVGPWKEKAFEVRKQANTLSDYIQTLKIDLIKEAEGKDTKAVEGTKVIGEVISSKDNKDIPANFMVDKGNGQKLKDKIVAFREYLVKLANGQKEIIESVNKTLETKDPPAEEGEKKTWITANFEHLPLIAVTTLMSKMQGDVRNAESEMIRYLYNQIEARSFKFNKLEATIIPNSNYIIKGNEYKAEVFVAAFDTTQSPEILIGQYQAVKGSDGQPDYQMIGKGDKLEIDPKTKKGIFRRMGSTLGLNHWSGIIKLRATDGTWIQRPFKEEFTVAEPNVVISPTKMNVFYIGVDNPVSISVPGVPDDKITAITTNGIIPKVGKGWIAKPTQLGNAIVSVMVDLEGNGKKKNMGFMEFRVKNIPDPVAKVAGMKSGKIDKKTLMEQAMVVADLEGFDFDAKFTVTEFTVSAKIKGFDRDEPVKSYKISDSQRQLISNAGKGDKVYFTNISAIGPDGKPRELNGIIFTIK